jgi:hypothetical protein
MSQNNTKKSTDKKSINNRSKKNNNNETTKTTKKIKQTKQIKNKQKGGQMRLKDENMKRHVLDSIKMTDGDNPEANEAEAKASKSPLWPGKPPYPDCCIM